MPTPSLCLRLGILVSHCVLSVGLVGAEISGDLAGPRLILDEHFDDAASVAAWTYGGSRFDNGAVKIVSMGTDTTTLIRHDLPVGAIAGRTIKISARIKGDGLGKPLAYVNGVKIRLDLTDATGKRRFLQAHPAYGEQFDWRQESFKSDVPADTTAAALSIGVERVAGTVWFDDVKVEILPGQKSP